MTNIVWNLQYGNYKLFETLSVSVIETVKLRGNSSFLAIGGIDDHHSLNIIFIIQLQ
jgi:hypothetical protein